MECYLAPRRRPLRITNLPQDDCRHLLGPGALVQVLSRAEADATWHRAEDRVNGRICFISAVPCRGSIGQAATERAEREHGDLEFHLSFEFHQQQSSSSQHHYCPQPAVGFQHQARQSRIGSRDLFPDSRSLSLLFLFLAHESTVPSLRQISNVVPSVIGRSTGGCMARGGHETVALQEKISKRGEHEWGPAMTKHVEARLS